MACNYADSKNAFIELYQLDALQPRAYELLIDRLTEKFSNLTEECDKQYKSSKLIPEVHGGRNTKAFRKMVKDYETNEFIEESRYSDLICIFSFLKKLLFRIFRNVNLILLIFGFYVFLYKRSARSFASK